jgi:NADH:ubiquinone oxidoreductase subunit K
VSLENVLLVSGILFAIGLYGALAKRNAIVVLMSIEIMFNAVNVAAIGFSRYTLPQQLTRSPLEVTTEAVQAALTGQVFAVFVITVAAAEVALGLALVLAIYRSRQTVEVTDLNAMRR